MKPSKSHEKQRKKSTKKKSAKKSSRKRSSCPKKQKEPIEMIFDPRTLIFLFGIALIIDIILMLIYFIGERLQVAPIMMLNPLSGLTLGESVLFYHVIQIFGIWAGLVVLTAFFRLQFAKKKKKGK